MWCVSRIRAIETRCGLTAILERTCSNRAATPKQVMVSFTERSFDDPLTSMLHAW